MSHILSSSERLAEIRYFPFGENSMLLISEELSLRSACFLRNFMAHRLIADPWAVADRNLSSADRKVAQTEKVASIDS